LKLNLKEYSRTKLQEAENHIVENGHKENIPNEEKC
jgi:hypothetical protein